MFKSWISLLREREREAVVVALLRNPGGHANNWKMRDVWTRTVWKEPGKCQRRLKAVQTVREKKIIAEGDGWRLNK